MPGQGRDIMKRVDLYDLNPARKDVIDLRSDVCREQLAANACCLRFKSLKDGRFDIPDLQMIQVRANFCLICGRRIK